MNSQNTLKYQIPPSRVCWNYISLVPIYTVQKCFLWKNLLSKCKQINKKLLICSYLKIILKEKAFFWAVTTKIIRIKTFCKSFFAMFRSIWGNYHISWVIKCIGHRYFFSVQVLKIWQEISCKFFVISQALQ